MYSAPLGIEGSVPSTSRISGGVGDAGQLPPSLPRKNIEMKKQILAAVMVMGTMAAPVVLNPAPADAAVTAKPKGKIVTPRNADVIASCKFQVNRVATSADHTVHYTLTANARPADLDGYRANAYTQVDCYLLPPGDTDPDHAFVHFDPSTNGATLSPRSYTSTVPYFESYTLCGQATVKLKNGDTSVTPYVCA